MAISKVFLFTVVVYFILPALNAKRGEQDEDDLIKIMRDLPGAGIPEDTLDKLVIIIIKIF